MRPAAPHRTAAGGRLLRSPSNSSRSNGRVSAFLAVVLLLLHARTAVCDPSPVSLRWIRLAQTHDMLGWTPSVYFQCEGEEKRALTGVESAETDYNFTLHESFQPLTELQPPQCKRCGVFEADTWTRDDTFAVFELCPLAFSAPPASQLHLNFSGEFLAVLSCPACNPNGKALYSEEGTAVSGALSPILITFAVIGGLACLAGLTALLVYVARRNGCTSFTLPLFMRRRMDPNTAKFLEMFEEEEDGLMEARLRDGGDGLGLGVSSAPVVVGDGKEVPSSFTISPDHSRQDD